MKKGVIWILLACLMVVTLVLASCGSSTTTSTPATNTTSNPTSTSVTTSNITTTSTTAITSTTVISTTVATTSSTGNWWDNNPTPQYGGDLTYRDNANVVNFDPYNPGYLNSAEDLWMEKIHVDNWTINPAVFNFPSNWRPQDFIQGGIAQSWEMTNPHTYVVHLRQNIYYQNISPVNGRQLVASDVVYHYNRVFGVNGNTNLSTFFSWSPFEQLVTSVTAPDKYTVVFNWKTSNVEQISETMQEIGNEQCIECPEAVAQWGNLNNWHSAIGSGPFILQDFVDGSSLTVVKNPSYWGYDERYPQNRLPYINSLKILIIQTDATALAAFRTAKIDIVDNLTNVDATNIQKTNPGMIKSSTPQATGLDVDPRYDVKPYNDIRVREALQLAIDLPTIASTYYGGTTDPTPLTLTSYYLTGWVTPFSQWPASLQAEYTYNPTQAKQLLTAAGYPNGFNTDVVADNSADLVLLQIVQSYFAAVGVKMSISTLDPTTFDGVVQGSHNFDALSYKNGGQLGLTFEPSSQVGELQTGNPNNWCNVSDPKYDAFVTQALAATSVDQVKQILLSENTYVAQQHYMISLLQPNLFNFTQPWVHGYTGQLQSVPMNGGSGACTGFYAARFWVDQNLKTASGK